MKKFNFLIVALIVSIAFVACSKSDYEPYDYQKYLALEAPILKDYADSISVELEKPAVLDEETGIWYIIEEEGLTDKEDPTFYTYKVNESNGIEAPRIRANYIGKLVSNGVVFDETNMVEGKYLSLGSVIAGWQAAFLPEQLEDNAGKMIDVGGFTELGLQKGAKIRLIIPSPFGYANQVRDKIPENSPLDFSIEVLEIKGPAASSTN